MKSAISFLSTLLVLLILSSCQSDRVLPDDCEALDRNTDRFENATSDDFDFLDAKVESDCLLLTVRYGGGCDTVNFDLVAYNGSRFSLPPQIPMRLILDDDDFCKALVTEEIAFDLSILQDQGAGILMLDLEGWEEMLKYEY